MSPLEEATHESPALGAAAGGGGGAAPPPPGPPPGPPPAPPPAAAGAAPPPPPGRPPGISIITPETKGLAMRESFMKGWQKGYDDCQAQAGKNQGFQECHSKKGGCKCVCFFDGYDAAWNRAASSRGKGPYDH